MAFSVLFPQEKALAPNSIPFREEAAYPPFFIDLNLDQIVDSVTATKDEYRLRPFYSQEPNDLTTIHYRQEIFRDVERPEVLSVLRTWERNLRTVREHLAQAEKRFYERQKQAWFLDAVERYVAAVVELQEGLSFVRVQAKGLAEFVALLNLYTQSEAFQLLTSETRQLKGELSAVRYEVQILGNSVQVRRFQGEPDLSVEVEETFEKFRQGDVKDHRLEFLESADMNHVEAQILDLVARLWPETFSKLADFPGRRAGFQNELPTRFDREIQFYVAYLDHLRQLRGYGLSFCYPQIDARLDSAEDPFLFQREAFDLALAYQLFASNLPIVTNEFRLDGPERILVVTGPNQGGKTTFARAFGQAHYLANLGCPVPGTEARLVFYDRLFTHFEVEERLESAHGKLFDDLVRMRDITARITSKSVFVFNEIFNSTTLQDSIQLARRVLELVGATDAVGVCVTFLDELASLNEKTVSMTSTVAPEDPAIRTFRIVRRPADGLAFALAIAEKHRLTYEKLVKRLPS